MMKHPPWIRVKFSNNDQFVRTRQLVNTHHLHTVCESASCPNIGECWGRGTATFMILGNTCMRDCRFCDVPPGQPKAVDVEEPRRVAEAIRLLSLQYTVITSVTRDDLSDGGAQIWGATIQQIRNLNPNCRIEVLIPDFHGDATSLHLVFQAQPDILGHNLETVPRLYPTARPQAEYQRSLDVLCRAKNAGLITKSGMMLGMGETRQEVQNVMQDLREIDCDILALGQYLQPTKSHVPIERYWRPEEFQQLKTDAEKLGFLHVEAGPLVRSSYHADVISAKAGIHAPNL